MAKKVEVKYHTNSTRNTYWNYTISVKTGKVNFYNNGNKYYVSCTISG